ncbi:4c7b6f1d-7a12-4ea0-85f9-44a004cd2fe0 [Thermothielavioides terrestris]|uniref:4c7b6f1d-7a12-4ea0-85f9-44a004cd2fe0 n=1 Tax=Thermothielavioides terrestris TaxID=2587410 RepID=A0A446BXL3_9PEZI|nr:4c7b6f1d-7a12-4ea0-85f9-44a004cd2fe0 [Thermothielavioides terrestris]
MPSQKDITRRRGEPSTSTSSTPTSRRSTTRDAILARKQTAKRCRLCRSLAGHPSLAALQAAHAHAGDGAGAGAKDLGGAGGVVVAETAQRCGTAGCGAWFASSNQAVRHRAEVHGAELAGLQAAQLRAAAAVV